MGVEGCLTFDVTLDILVNFAAGVRERNEESKTDCRKYAHSHTDAPACPLEFPPLYNLRVHALCQCMVMLHMILATRWPGASWVALMTHWRDVSFTTTMYAMWTNKSDQGRRLHVNRVLVQRG